MVLNQSNDKLKNHKSLEHAHTSLLRTIDRLIMLFNIESFGYTVFHNTTVVSVHRELVARSDAIITKIHAETFIIINRGLLSSSPIDCRLADACNASTLENI